MLLIDIEKQVKPLSRKEKWQLIKDIQEMLMQEETELQNLSKPGFTYPLFTPVGLEEGAGIRAGECALPEVGDGKGVHEHGDAGEEGALGHPEAEFGHDGVSW